jgi:hypothetical protein
MKSKQVDGLQSLHEAVGGPSAPVTPPGANHTFVAAAASASAASTIVGAGGEMSPPLSGSLAEGTKDAPKRDDSRDLVLSPKGSFIPQSQSLRALFSHCSSSLRRFV